MIITKPPMGWNSWNTFGENINEKVVMETADQLVESGLKDCGYEYVIIDDCWSLRERNEKGEIVPDPEKFPHGMKYVSDYVHSKGLKFGMYSCAGTLTCARYPGSYDHEFVDAECFARWGVDYLKYDYCFHPSSTRGHYLYKRMGLALANCGRDIVFAACSWGAENTKTWIKETGAHTWRSTGDINDSWESIKHLAQDQMQVTEYNGSGCFNDMDMLVVGMNGRGNVAVTGCTADEYRTHFAFWAMMGSPLIIGCDLRKADGNAMAILKNRMLIEIDQDEAYRQPFFINAEREFNKNRTPGGTLYESYPLDECILARFLSNGDIALGAFNFRDGAVRLNAQLDSIGLGECTGKTLELTSAWTGKTSRVTNGTLIVELGAHCCEVFRAKVVDK
ncbi:MAG: glycoside hydrolase family 27 protein [Clostridiales bacterium]|nr:glycoside hydrolase family 27 protein [Clostridiales bacterium]